MTAPHRFLLVVALAGVFLIALSNAIAPTTPTEVPCYTPGAPDNTSPAIPVRYLDAKVPDIQIPDMIGFTNSFGTFSRDFFGCQPRETDPAKCVVEAGGINGPAWRAARPYAERIFNLREK